MNIDFNEQLEHLNKQLDLFTKIKQYEDFHFRPINVGSFSKEFYIKILLDNQPTVLSKFYARNIVETMERLFKTKYLYKAQNKNKEQDYIDFLIEKANTIEQSIKDKKLTTNEFLTDVCNLAENQDEYYTDFEESLRQYIDPYSLNNSWPESFFNYKCYWVSVFKLFIKIQLAQNLIEIKDYIQQGGDKREVYNKNMIYKGIY